MRGVSDGPIHIKTPPATCFSVILWGWLCLSFPHLRRNPTARSSLQPHENLQHKVPPLLLNGARSLLLPRKTLLSSTIKQKTTPSPLSKILESPYAHSFPIVTNKSVNKGSSYHFSSPILQTGSKFSKVKGHAQRPPAGMTKSVSDPKTPHPTPNTMLPSSFYS